ncbi:MAG: hypothetical protein DYG98_22695 [Haliscomenobacteraceae bacterium CHB4]|nr:hypothetical protein [Saprospiraceae bacterium]MCE7925869.1 hypothetical protein [Haliscomenobacteraceae bacterium CHB4]
MASQIKDFEWDVLLEKLESPRCECALILGEGAFFTPGGQLLKDQYNNFLDKNHAGLFKRQHDDDLLSMADHARTTFCTKVRGFYATEEPDEFLRHIARIPFPLIINTTPHGQIAKAFDSNTPQLRHFDRSAQQKKIEKPDAAHPLIYNLVGTIEDDNTLVLTYNNLFDYFVAIFGEYGLPSELREILKDVKYFVFLGVPFDRWYFHLFLRILNIQAYNNAHRHALEDSRFKKGVMKFCNELFQIEFVIGRSNVAEFAAELYRRCEAANILRTGTDDSLSTMELIEKQLKHDELEHAITLLDAFLKEQESDDLADDLAIMSARFRKYNKGVLNGTLDPSNARTEHAQIVNGLNEILKSARKLPTI